MYLCQRDKQKVKIERSKKLDNLIKSGLSSPHFNQARVNDTKKRGYEGNLNNTCMNKNIFRYESNLATSCLR